MLSRVNYHPKWQSRSSDCSLIMVTTSTLDFLCLVHNIPSYTARDCPQVTLQKTKKQKKTKKQTKNLQYLQTNKSLVPYGTGRALLETPAAVSCMFAQIATGVSMHSVCTHRVHTCYNHMFLCDFYSTNPTML